LKPLPECNPSRSDRSRCFRFPSFILSSIYDGAYTDVIWNNFYKYAVKNSVKFSFTEQFANSPLVDRVRKEEGMSYFQSLFEWFERGKREKVFKDMPKEIFSAFAFAPLIGLVKQHFCGEVVLDARVLKTVYEITWKAVTK
jgi:TetR/AcrR family transcriptional repressor of multidrug resistance operon